MQFLTRQTVLLTFFFLFLSGGIMLHAQELTKDPVGGWEDESTIAPVSSFNHVLTAIPSALGIEPLNRLYTSWDTLYVRRYSDARPSFSDSLELVFDTSSYVFPVKGQLLSPFGYRGRRVHAGIDIRLNLGDTVVAAFDGIVRMARYYSGYGNCVIIRHFNGLETLYGHLSKIRVKVNQPVKAGDLVGLGGHTGRASCNHLHFETRVSGIAFNPRQVINLDDYTLVKDTFLLHDRVFGRNRDYMPSVTGQGDDLTASASAARNKAARKYYTIRSGDTLSSISRKNGTNVKKLCAINGIKSTKTLRPGTRIRVR